MKELSSAIGCKNFLLIGSHIIDFRTSHFLQGYARSLALSYSNVKALISCPFLYEPKYEPCAYSINF
jgi:hypothetical protein